MEFLLGLPLLFAFIVLYIMGKTPIRILILLQVISIFTSFLVAKQINHQTFTTFFNVLFVNLNIFLIIAPWRLIKFKNVFVKNNNRFLFFKKILYKFLFLHIFLNTTILVIVFIFIPDISKFKAGSGYLDLYEQIPYFANVFRYAYVTQNLGYLAIPICFYHLGKFEIKKSIIALIYSSSSLIFGFATYSRASIFTFAVVFIVYFFLVKHTLPQTLQKKFFSGIKKTTFILASLFLVMTVIRFSSMDYYGDRIPEESIIKDPVVYSVVDYASQGYSNGLNLLENYSGEKNLKGEQLFYNIYQILNFFGIYEWSSDESQYKTDEAYGGQEFSGVFNGYTTYLVFNFGYIITFFISLIYFVFVLLKLNNGSRISLEKMYILVLLLVIPIVSIFYCGFGALYFPLIFLLFTNFLFFNTKMKVIFK